MITLSLNLFVLLIIALFSLIGLITVIKFIIKILKSIFNKMKKKTAKIVIVVFYTVAFIVSIATAKDFNEALYRVITLSLTIVLSFLKDK